MSTNSLTLTLFADTKQVNNALAGTNKILEEFERQATSAGAAGSKALDGFTAQSTQAVKAADRQREAIERQVAALEKRAKLAGKNSIEAVDAERQVFLSQNKNLDPAQIERATSAFDKLKKVQLELAEIERRDTIQRQTEKIDRERQAIEREVKALERRAALLGKSGGSRVALERQAFLEDNRGLDPAQLDRATRAFQQIEQAQQKGSIASRIWEGSIGSLIARLSVVGLAVTGISKLVEIVKEGSIGSALYAARTEQLGVALDAVAKANNISAAAANAEAVATERLGIVRQDARQGVARLIAAQLDYTRASELARAAQDTGRIAGISSAEAFERITNAIVTAQPEMLRTLGISVNFEQVYSKTARTLNKGIDQLTESEKAQARLNVTLEKAAAYTGVYEASAKSAGGQLLSMPRYVDELRDALGERLQPALGAAVSGMISLLRIAKESIPVIEDFATVAAKPFRDLNDAAQRITDMVKSLGGGVQGDKFDKLFVDFFRNRAREMRGREVNLEKLNSEFQAQLGNALGAGMRDAAKQPEIDLAASIVKNALDRQEKGIEAISTKISQTRTARENLMRELRNPDPKNPIGAEAAREKAQQLDNLSAQLRGFEAQKEKLDQLAQQEKDRLRLAQRGREELAQRAKITSGLTGTSFEVKVDDSELRKAADAQQNYYIRAYQEQLRFAEDTQRLRVESIDRDFAAQQDDLTRERDLKLGELDRVAAQDISTKLGVVSRRLEVEKSYLASEAILQIEALEREKNREIEYMDTLAKLKPEMAAEIANRVAAVNEKAGSAAAAIERKWLNDRSKLEIDASVDRQKLIVDEQKRTFDSLKNGFEGLFDTLLFNSKNFASALRRTLLAGFLTPVKQAAGNLFASAFTPLFAGQSAGFGGIGSLGLFGGLGALSRPGAPGGTGGFAGPVSGLPFGASVIGANGQPITMGGAGIGGLGNLGMLASAKGLLAQLGMLGATNKAFSAGVYGAKGGAMLAGGGILAYDGLRRGGMTGLFETAAGGALIGAKFGGPIGAMIGGAAGAAAGLARLFIKGASDKAREKVKSVYSVDVSSKDILQQFVAIAKQSYGGNLDVAVRSQEVRDIVELYAMSTGQSATGLKPQMQPLSISQRGGVLSILSNYSNGRPVSPVTGSPAPAAPMVVQLQLDAATTEMVLEGRAVSAMANNPRAVQGAVVNAQRANVGRQQSAVNMFAPGLILS